MFKKILFITVVAVTCSSCDSLTGLMNNAPGALTDTEIASGLKEALSTGVTHGTGILSQTDGFFKNAAVKILLPPAAQNVADKLSGLGMGGIVDACIMKINRGAEDAAKKAGPIFLNSIKQMTFSDVRNILFSGKDNSATEFFKKTTTQPLYAAFNPVIKSSLNSVGAADAWTTIISNYNRIPFVTQVNPSLDDHVTNKAIDGVFYMVANEEKSIRKDPLKRATDLLKKVFGAADKK